MFTHEFGHAINLSHSQVNGPMVYSSLIEAPYYPGMPRCVAPVHRFDYSATAGANRANPAMLETMYPFLNHKTAAGIEQSTVDMPDDIAGISNLYPTASYKATRGSISGVLRLKDGKPRVQRHQRHRPQRRQPAVRRRVEHDRQRDAG